MRPRRGAAIVRLSDAIFTQFASFPCDRLPSIPRNVRVARHESVVSQAAVPFARATVPRKHYAVIHIFQAVFEPMTLRRAEETPMDVVGKLQSKEDGKSSRPVRSRRYTRRSLVAGQRPQKRLFTPEIKRYLKDWLVRRRDNPYPNREEKKNLATETGLTYIQICNWFANWRRKLKNVDVERNQQTWGHLIRTYNDRAQGNVEQFSICSDDSIWSETDHISPSDSLDVEHRYIDSPEMTEYQREDSNSSSLIKENCTHFNNNTEQDNNNDETKSLTSPLLLSKWLESAARFQPSETNYSWWADGKRRRQEKAESKVQRLTLKASRHDKDEVEAAMALTTLASATRLTAP